MTYAVDAEGRTLLVGRSALVADEGVRPTMVIRQPADR
jgi:hypothetical protein